MRIPTLLAFIVTLVLFGNAHAASRFNAPEGMVRTELSNKTFTADKYATEDDLLQAILMVQVPVHTQNDANDMARGMVSGLSKKGFIQESVTDFTHQGMPGKHIIGQIPLGDDYGSFRNDTYLVFGAHSTYILTYNRHDSVTEAPPTAEILKRFTIDDQAARLADTGSSVKQSTAFQMGEKIGYYGFFVLLGAFVISAIRKRIKA